LISAEYAIIRPVSNSLFLTAYGSSALPFAWIAVVPLNLLIVALYNQYLPRVGCFKMFVWVGSLTVCIQLFCSFWIHQFTSLPFLFYLWKEVYIMLMFQQLWSVIHVTVAFKQARYLYGLFFALGALGATLGSMVPGFLAVKMGSESLLLATLPIYLLLGLCYYCALKQTKEGPTLHLNEEKKHTSIEAFVHGVKLITSSRYLLVILLLVTFMQVSSTLIDFQFNRFLEEKIVGTDLRTQYTGRILSVVHTLTLSFQLFGSFLFIHYLGVKRTHLLIPLLLCINGLAFQCFPLFGMISFAYISIKSSDFSLFTILKELLYNPLKPDEKFRAKAVIDVFAHRSSKALASLLILGLQALFGLQFISYLNWGGIALFFLWMGTVIFFLKEPSLQPD
jgi:AAA family ATP:ADP antiporter